MTKKITCILIIGILTIGLGYSCGGTGGGGGSTGTTNVSLYDEGDTFEQFGTGVDALFVRVNSGNKEAHCDEQAAYDGSYTETETTITVSGTSSADGTYTKYDGNGDGICDSLKEGLTTLVKQ